MEKASGADSNSGWLTVTYTLTSSIDMKPASRRGRAPWSAERLHVRALSLRTAVPSTDPAATAPWHGGPESVPDERSTHGPASSSPRRRPLSRLDNAL